MSKHESVYAHLRLNLSPSPHGRRLVAVLVAAVAVMVGLGAPALASAGGTSHQVVASDSGPVGSITGQVNLPNPGYRYDRSVIVRNLTTHVATTARVAPDGSYSVANLEAGTYRVAFNRLSGPAFAAAQFYNGREESQGAAGATPVTVAGGQVTAGINATLEAGGHITGKLVNAAHQPLSCVLQAYTPGDTLVTRRARSGPNGAFDISGLTSGAYHLRVLAGSPDCQNATQYYTNGGGVLAKAPDPNMWVSVTLGVAAAIALPVVYDQAPLVMTAPPTITGTPLVGAGLTVTSGTWSRSPLTFIYHWLAGGEPIDGATKTTYVPKASVVGKSLSVRVVVSRHGYKVGTAVSASLGPVTGVFSLKHMPVVTGKAVVGGKLKVTGTTLTPGADKATYQWLRNGKKIKKATKSTYQPTVGDKGAKISVRVTYTRHDYQPLVLVTKSSKKVTP